MIEMCIYFHSHKPLNREIEVLNNIEADKIARGDEYEDFPRLGAMLS